MPKAGNLLINFYLNVNKCNKLEHTQVFSKAMCLPITPDRNLVLLSFGNAMTESELKMKFKSTCTSKHNSSCCR